MEMPINLNKTMLYKIVKAIFIILCIGALTFSLLYAFGPGDSFYSELLNSNSENEETAYQQNNTQGDNYGSYRM